jgi:hypothetical protein
VVSTHDSGQTSVDFVTQHDHGILVVEQLGSRAEHVFWNVDADGAHVEADSLYVAVRPSMEGAVSTSVRSAAVSPTENLELVVEARLEVSSGVLLVGDSDRNVELRLPVNSGTVEVAVFVDEIGFASHALILLAPGSRH